MSQPQNTSRKRLLVQALILTRLIFVTVFTIVIVGNVVVGALVAQTAQHTENIYTDSLQGNWTDSSWGSTVNLAASAPGRTGNALEVTINGAWQAFRLSVSGDGRFLNEYASIDFDIYIHSDSTGLDNLVFVLEEGWAASQPKLTDLISGWSTMTTAQRYN